MVNLEDIFSASLLPIWEIIIKTLAISTGSVFILLVRLRLLGDIDFIFEILIQATQIISRFNHPKFFWYYYRSLKYDW